MKKRPSLPLVVGRKPLLEILEQGKTVEKIFLLKTAIGDEILTIKKIARERLIPISLVPQEKLNRLTKTNHQGVVAWAGLTDYVALQEAISHVIEQGITPLFLLLDGITDIRNIGGIARTAYCLGIQGIILPTSSSASLTEEAIKTSAGALHQLLLSRVVSVSQAIDILRLNGFQILATEMKGSQTIHDVDFSLPTCIIMGSEEKGIGNEAKKLADGFVHIPMHHSFDSLNVSVATGIILYEAMKQRAAL